MGKHHIIELNGKRYDALTGKMVNDQHTARKIPSKSPISPPSGNVDGFARKSHRPDAPAPRSRNVQKSQTLMRTAVKKPTPHKIHAVASVVHHNSPAYGSKHKNLNAHINKHVPKSPLIRRFNPFNPDNTKAAITITKQAYPRSTQAAARSNVAASAANAAVNPLHQAIAQATSHREPKIKRPAVHHRMARKLKIQPRLVSGGMLVIAILLLAGFFGYQNLPNLQMRLAAQKAGIRGSLPAYQPPGFRLENISHKPGEVNISYKSNSDDRKFAVTQAASAWNSETLRDKLRPVNPVEVPDKGKTLFIYDESNITWVDGGIWYKIEGQSQLNSDQLLRLANSL